MPVSAIIMMIIALLVLWGGLAVAIVLLVRAKPAHTQETLNEDEFSEAESHNTIG